MIVAAVHQRHLHRGIFQGARGAEAAETAAEDYDFVRIWHSMINSPTKPARWRWTPLRYQMHRRKRKDQRSRGSGRGLRLVPSSPSGINSQRAEVERASYDETEIIEGGDVFVADRGGCTGSA